MKFIIQNAYNVLVYFYGLLSYSASSPAVAGHSSYGQLLVQMDVHPCNCPFLDC